MTSPESPSLSAFSVRPPSAESTELYLGQNAFAGVGPLAQYGPTFVAYIRANSTSAPDVEDLNAELWVSPASPSSSSKPSLDVALVLMRPFCSSLDIALSKDGKVIRKNVHIHENCRRDSKTMKEVEGFVKDALRKVGYVGDFKAGDDMNHWAGSCKLGTCADPATLTAFGTQNVLVADASILPTQVWAHPQLTLQALALKASDTIAATLEAESYIIP
eukprot:TRINITY_DN19911_c0_g1_i1.p1 TRINITY_DN19911_c0_g1~~TRINITY_DN19911_c0_g1_i1.p1  ORF type:complete len:233 (+),score=38.79 TRINITY_DN19911_c0_g1_i1:47-700(+)